MTERKGSTVDLCMEALNTVIADLQKQGVIDTVLVASLAEAAIQTAKAEKDYTQTHLDALAVITKAATDAHRAGTVINMAQVVCAGP